MTLFELLSILTIVSPIYSHVLIDVNVNDTSKVFLEQTPPIIFINVICNTSKDCTVNNTECLHGRCSCIDGYTVAGTLLKCLRVATGYNDKCEENIQCSEFLSAGGKCDNGVCVCLEGYHYLHGFCRRSKGLNEACSNDDECFVNSEHKATSCVDGVCKCSNGYYQREYTACRRKAQKLGEDCYLDSDCAFIDKNAKCVELKCSLKKNDENKNFLADYAIFNDDDDDDDDEDDDEDDEKADEKSDKISVGSVCDKDSDCASLENSHCAADKKCTCVRSHFPSSKFDACVKEIGESCKASDKIIISGSVCKNGTWTCNVDRVSLKSNQFCRQVTNFIGEDCQYQESCQLFGPRANCEKKKCICDSSSHWLESERFCWLTRGVDEICEDSRDCRSRGHSPRIVCRSTKDKPAMKVCSCPDGTRLSANGEYCVNKKPEFGSYCEQNEDCGIENSSCSKNNECQCAENYFNLDGSCYKDINATCKVNDECKRNNSVCFDDKCRCDNNFVVDSKNECILKSSYKSICTRDVQCSSSVFNTFCSFDINSTVDASEGFEGEKIGRCECLPDHFYNVNACFKKKRLGEECSREGECFAKTSNAYCRNGKCSCGFDYKQEGKTCVKGNNAPSLSNLQFWLILPTTGYFLLQAL